MSQVPHGARVWDSSGRLILGEQDFTMRVLGFLQFRDTAVRTSPFRVDVPGAGPGVAAILAAVQGAMSYNQSAYSAMMPSVFVGDGYLEFRPVNHNGWNRYQMIFDVVLVSTL